MDDPWGTETEQQPSMLLVRREPMFRPTSLSRGDIATDLAIPLIADGGWHSMTLRSLAREARISSAAVAAWFGSTARGPATAARRGTGTGTGTSPRRRSSRRC